MDMVSIKLDFSFEGDGGRTCHEDVLVTLAPFDVEGAAIHAYVALTACPASEMGCYGCGACSCATSEGDAGTTFPYTHTERVLIEALSKLYVAALREKGIVFQ